MNPATLKNLTLASAKHLVSQGHITPAHHKRIVKKIGGASQSSGMRKADETPPGAFGSLHPVMGGGAGHYMGSMPGEDDSGGGSM